MNLDESRVTTDELRIDAEGVDALIDRIYALGWNAALGRVDREMRALDNSRRIDKAEVLAVLLNLRRPALGPLAVVESEERKSNGEER